MGTPVARRRGNKSRHQSVEADVNRRRFLHLTGLATVASVAAGGPAQASDRTPKIRAVVFDAFPIFDPRSIAALAEELFPRRSTELINLWRTRQFEYTWLRSL